LIDHSGSVRIGLGSWLRPPPLRSALGDAEQYSKLDWGIASVFR